MITFESVTKRYPGGTVAVDSLDLEVPGGQTMVLVGPSGCGKTTTLRMINRLIEPTSGRILLDGADILQENPSTLRRGIGYVIQQSGLFPHRTIEDNIGTVPAADRLAEGKARDRARELMTLVGLDEDLARRYPYQLSGGQQQRVGVARALAADPPVLLMDEPFSAVDPIVRATLQDELLRLQAELHKTMVLVTHDVEEAIKVGDQVAIFRPRREDRPAGHARAAARRARPTATWRTSSASTGASAGCRSWPPPGSAWTTGPWSARTRPRRRPPTRARQAGEDVGAGHRRRAPAPRLGRGG